MSRAPGTMLVVRKESGQSALPLSEGVLFQQFWGREATADSLTCLSVPKSPVITRQRRQVTPTVNLLGKCKT